MKKIFTATRLRRLEIISGLLLFIFSVGFFSLKTYSQKLPLRVSAATPQLCTIPQKPVGAVGGEASAIWCYEQLSKEITTYKETANSFIDTFKTGIAFTNCCGGYSIFQNNQSDSKAVYWRQNNNWYVDTQGKSTLIRPNKSFTFENGKLIVETTMSSSMPGYTEKNLSEIVITSAETTTNTNQNTYAINAFPAYWTVGCRIVGSSQRIVCSLLNDKKNGNTILYEKTVPPSVTGKAAWKQCKTNESFSNCENTYRFELSRTSLVIFVNDIRYGQLTNLSPLPEALLKGKVYVYFATTNLTNSEKTYRYHWGSIAINPVSVTPTKKSSLTITPTPSKKNYSIQFKGTGFARVSHASYYNVPKGWTIETWFKDESPEGYNHETRYILTKGDTTTTANIPYIMGIEYDNLFIGTRNYGENKVMTYNLPQNNIAANTWHHVAATYDNKSDEIILYIDGVSVLRAIVSTYTTEENTQPLYIGKNGSKNFWLGKLDDVRIWDTARTPVHIRDTYQTQFTSPQKHLIGNWRFDEGKGNTAIDISSNKENGLIIKGLYSQDIPTDMR